MKIKDAHIGLQVVTSDIPDATVYEIVELYREGNQVAAVLKCITYPHYSDSVTEVCYLSIPTAEQLAA